MKQFNYKKDFPILSRKVHGLPLVYLDSTATSQKPKSVIAAIANYYKKSNANVHRGVHTLGDEATLAYHQARENVADFIGSKDSHEIIFTRNTTEAINLVAYTWGQANIKRGDIILTTELEHHSNIVPWQMLAQRVKAKVVYIKINHITGELDQKDLESKLKLNPKLLAIGHVSNFLGTIHPIKKISSIMHDSKFKIPILVDGAQSVPHLSVDVNDLGVDFYAFSGHKMLGPMGIGVLWVRKKILDDMPVFLTGGGMIDSVTTTGSTFAPLPDRYDAGTPDVASAVGLSAAIDYLNSIGMNKIRQHEIELNKLAIGQLNKINGLKIYGPKDPEKRGGVISFTIDGIHAHDIAQILDRKAGVAVRSGHHCTMPMHLSLNLAATTRASFYLYNDESDINQLVWGIKQVKKVFE